MQAFVGRECPEVRFRYSSLERHSEMLREVPASSNKYRKASNSWYRRRQDHGHIATRDGTLFVIIVHRDNLNPSPSHATQPHSSPNLPQIPLQNQHIPSDLAAVWAGRIDHVPEQEASSGSCKGSRKKIATVTRLTLEAKRPRPMPEILHWCASAAKQAITTAD